MKRRTVIALVLGRISRARIHDAMVGTDELQFVATVDELRTAVQRPVNALTVVAEATDSRGQPVAPLLHDLSQRMPGVALIGYIHADSPSSEILALANCGIDELIQEDVDDTISALRAAYIGSIEACAARAVRLQLAGLVPATLRRLVDFCLQYPREDLSIAGIARALGCDRKTLLNHCDRAQFPSPSGLVMWCRLLLAASILESMGYSVERVSNQLEFPSPSAFRNACRRYTGQRPSDWRQPGGLARVVARFAAAVADPS
jgi:AraC-like DNA-binding protein